MYVELLGFIRSFFYLIYEMSRPLPSDIRSFVFPVCPRSLGLHGEKTENLMQSEGKRGVRLWKL